MNQDYPKGLKIPEFIQDLINYYYNIIYQIVPSRHECGCIFARFPRSRRFDFIYLYRNWFKRDLRLLIEQEFKFKCPNCNQILINEHNYNAIFIDLDSKAAFIYDEDISKKKQDKFYDWNFNHYGYKLKNFDSAKVLKDTLIKKYKPEEGISKLDEYLNYFRKEIEIPDCIENYLYRKYSNISEYFLTQEGQYKCECGNINKYIKFSIFFLIMEYFYYQRNPEIFLGKFYCENCRREVKILKPVEFIDIKNKTISLNLPETSEKDEVDSYLNYYLTNEELKEIREDGYKFEVKIEKY